MFAFIYLAWSKQIRDYLFKRLHVIGITRIQQAPSTEHPGPRMTVQHSSGWNLSYFSTEALLHSLPYHALKSNADTLEARRL